MLGGTWQIATVKEAAGDAEISFAPIPTHDDKVSAKLMAGTCLAVNAASEEKDLALEFLSYFADDAQLSRWVESQSCIHYLKGRHQHTGSRSRAFCSGSGRWKGFFRT